MDSAPDSPPTAATQAVSLWQMNMVGLRAERFFGVEKLGSNGVLMVSSIAYVAIAQAKRIRRHSIAYMKRYQLMTDVTPREVFEALSLAAKR